ncbi:MAG: hypothetical protein ACLFM7_08235 [Bacteroidales bacterium]
MDFRIDRLALRNWIKYFRNKNQAFRNSTHEVRNEMIGFSYLILPFRNHVQAFFPQAKDFGTANHMPG